MTQRAPQIVILAAGKGSRMKSARPKVLHGLAGRSMLAHVMALAAKAGAAAPAVVIGPDMQDVRAEVLNAAPAARFFVQQQQKGTADAVLAARQAIDPQGGEVIVLYGDTPLIEIATIERLQRALGGGAADGAAGEPDQDGAAAGRRAAGAAITAGADVVVLGFDAADPTGYGRLLCDDSGQLRAIREHKDASIEERRIRLCNSGVLGLRAAKLLPLLERINSNNANGEYYLTDAIEIAHADGLAIAAISCPEEEVLGINTRVQLAQAEAIYQARARHRFMLAGVTMIAPETVWFSHDTEIAGDVIIEPNVFFGPGVSIAEGALIRANSHLEGARVGAGARIGPYARLRPGARIGDQAHIGNFVEVKNVTLGEGAKANHLAYLGDGSVGARANIGAGTIFCNYDGFNKSQTTIGAGAFIGSNSALVAPLEIGDGAYIGSGSVITKSVSPDALALERSKQQERPGWAARFRDMMQRRKTRT